MRSGAAATRLLLGLGLVGGIWVVSVGDAAAGPLDGAPPAPKVTLPVARPKVPSVGAATEPLPLPAPVDRVARGLTAPVDNTVQTVTAPVTGLVAPPPAAAATAPPAPAAAIPPAPIPPGAVAAAAVPVFDAAAVGAVPPAAAGPAATISPPAVEHGRLDSAPTGLRAVLDAARSSTALFLFAGAAALFLLVQGRLDRRSPRLADAPVDRRSEMLEFS